MYKIWKRIKKCLKILKKKNFKIDKNIQKYLKLLKFKLCYKILKYKK